MEISGYMTAEKAGGAEVKTNQPKLSDRLPVGTREMAVMITGLCRPQQVIFRHVPREATTNSHVHFSLPPSKSCTGTSIDCI